MSNFMGLKKECDKAARILSEFTMTSETQGIEKVIPATLILHAQGLAIISVIKAGFVVSGRGGHGIVIARLRTGEWSAPSSIGLVGFGGGIEFGAEVTHFVMILNNQQAVDAFSMGTNVTLGGNLTVAVGPYGRAVEGDVAVRSTAAVYTYSRSKGLFGGISLEGACLIERKDANKKFYGVPLRSREILNGAVSPPFLKTTQLYLALDKQDAVGKTEEAEQAAKRSQVKSHSPAAPRPPPPRSRPVSTGAQGPHAAMAAQAAQGAHAHAGSAHVERAPSIAAMWVKADWEFKALHPGDLSFATGDTFVVTRRTESTNDWWEGEFNGRRGLFPANYVHVR